MNSSPLQIGQLDINSVGMNYLSPHAKMGSKVVTSRYELRNRTPCSLLKAPRNFLWNN